METVGASKEGFVPGQRYAFDPPVHTNCILINGKGGWAQKSFSEGLCLGIRDGSYVFQGKPPGEKHTYFFKVDYGGGSIATEKPNPGD